MKLMYTYLCYVRCLISTVIGYLLFYSFATWTAESDIFLSDSLSFIMFSSDYQVVSSHDVTKEL